MVSHAVSHHPVLYTSIGVGNTPIPTRRMRLTSRLLSVLSRAQRRARAAYFGGTVPRRLISRGGRTSKMAEQKFLSIADAQLELGVSRSGIYRLITAGELDRIHIGGRAKITKYSIDRYVDYRLQLATTQRTGV